MNLGRRIAARCVRAARPGLGLTANPLRRRSDRWQGLATVASLLIMLSAVPLAVIVAASTWQHQTEAAAGENAVRWRTTVTVIERSGRTSERNGPATVSWQDQRGVTRHARTSLAGGLQVGQKVTVWTDDDGRLVYAPTSRADVLIATGICGLTVLLLAVLAGLLLHTGVTRRLDRIRGRQISVQWRHFNEAREQHGKS